MKKSVLRRLEALEAEQRARHKKEQQYKDHIREETERLRLARHCVNKMVIAFYVGGLKPNESPEAAYARALNYQSAEEFDAVMDKCIELCGDLEFTDDSPVLIE